MINPYATAFMIASRTEHMVQPKFRDVAHHNQKGRRRWTAPARWREARDF